LNSAEDSVYEKLKVALTKTRGSDNGNDDGHNNNKNNSKKSITSGEQKHFLAQQEYKLGLFFRKKHPASVQVPRARQHLTNCLKQYSTISSPETPSSSSSSFSSHRSEFAMANFWLGTLQEPAAGTADGDSSQTNANNNSNNNEANNSSNNNQVSRCPPEYIVGLYSTFADRFDELLVEKLQYKTPTILRQLFDEVVLLGGPTTLKHGLDLGCGTGISGLAFQDVVQKLDGVDLSPEMIAKARERNCYHSLKVADVVNALENGPGGATTASSSSYDLILACDVFCYIGDLSSVFASVKRLLSLSHGFFCFSTELLRHDDNTPQRQRQTNHHHDDEPFRLHSCARFSHTEDYIIELANQYDFDIVGKELSDCLRKNQGANVEGMLTILQPR